MNPSRRLTFGYRFVCLTLAYALLASLYAPLTPRAAAASPTAATAAVPPPARQRAAARDGELLVRFRDGVGEHEREALIGASRGRRRGALRGASGVERVEVTASLPPEVAAAELRSLPAVEFAEPNFLVRAEQVGSPDPRFGEQWALANAGQNGGTPGSDIGAEAAWRKATGSRQTVVAVIDSGIDFSHPDLANNRWANPRETENGRDDDGNGLTDDVSGWDWVTQGGRMSDPNGHGTSAAGIIAAEGNNGLGTAGVMWQSSLMSLRVLDNTGTGDVAAAVEALDYAVDHGASVVNLSWGTGGESRALRDAILRAGRRGVLVVCSAGNAGRNIDAEPYYPASYDLPNLLVVAANDNSDRIASWSNWGPQSVDIAAPGTAVLTTQPGGGYRVVNGTSAASPHVAGVAGLVKSLYPGMSPAGVKAAILSGVRRVAWLDGAVAGGGVVAAVGALDAAGSLPPGGGGGNEGGSGNGNGNGQGNGQENGQGGADNGNGGGQHGPSAQPGTPGRGTGGRGPGAGFDVEPPAPYMKAAPGFGNHDEIRRGRRSSAKAPVFVGANNLAMPVCDVDCGDSYPSGGASLGGYPSDPYFGTGRTRVENETGQPGTDLGSRNFNWGLPLVQLTGRAGLDLSVGLYYNSLVWTKQDRTIQFNGDHGFPGPGFRLGFPVVQPMYYDTDSGTNAYVLLTPSGGRVEMRQVNATNVFESADGTYTQLSFESGGGLVVRTTDGTQLRFTHNSSQNEYRVVEIKDRNGNYITINYDQNTTPGQLGRPTSIVDTLGRTINFNYSASTHYLVSITQTWRRDTQAGLGAQETHVWASFDYATLPMWPNFTDQYGQMAVIGPQNGAQIPVLTKVGLPDGTYYEFEYTTWGQIYRINRRSPAGWLLARTAYNLPTDTSARDDCPRFTERREWAAWWNGDTGDHTVGPGPEESVTTYSVDPGGAWALVTPPDPTPADPSDNVVYKEYFATSGWQKGLTLRTEAYHPSNPSSPMKWTTTSWTQDDTSLPYAKNPRTEEVNVYDSNNNRRRTRFQYGPYSLPAIIYEYAADGASLLRQTNFAYDLNSAFVDRRIIGLMSAREVYDVSTGSYVLASRTTNSYDTTPLENRGTVARHDGAAYGAGFQLGRGNLTAVHRFDTADPHNMAKASAMTTGYDTAGSVVWQEDGSAHRTSYDYSGVFTDGSTHSAYAFPTKETDPDGYYSTAQYNYDMGVIHRTVNPKGAEGKTFFDAAGRPERSLNVNNGAYTDYIYNPDWGHFITNTTVEAGRGLTYTNSIADGRGQVRLFVASHPNSAGGYLAVRYGFDALGRRTEQTNPTEIHGWGDPAGDDAATGFQRTLQSYDWQGRPTLTTHQNGNTTEVSYGGCGCAGGDVSTVRDERGRRKRYTKDVLGRMAKAEELNWDASVYSTTDFEYNARDQIKRINQAGLARVFEYDGHGRLWKRTTPEQGTTEYAYNPDDTVNWMKDARGAVTSLVYNNGRHLVNNINYTVPAGVAHTPNVRMEYDAAGNRTLMEDGLGSATYAYDALSRLDWEERRFNGVPGPNNGAFGIDYDYNLAGQLTRVNNPWGAHVTYEHDANGRTTAVRGTNTLGQPSYAGVDYYAQNMAYRAFGALKAASYKNGRTLSTQYDTRQRLSQWNVAGVFGYNYSYDKFGENSFRVTHAQHLTDPTLNRSFDYDHVGRLWEAHSGSEADAHANGQPFPAATGPFSQSYRYDVWGNETYRVGWGGYFGAYINYSQTFTNNRRDGLAYDLAGNLTNDGSAQYVYDATGQQASSVLSVWWQGYANYTITQNYDGDGLRAKKAENGEAVYYVRSAALGGRVLAEVRYNAAYGGWYWSRGYVYAGAQLLAIQDGAVRWTHQDPVTKGQRLTDINGSVTAAVDLDPWGGETGRSWGQAQQPRRFTTYERDGIGNDQAGFRAYLGGWHRFAQPDPADFSYDHSDPQSFNRYSYTRNDPVNFTDPTGLDPEKPTLGNTNVDVNDRLDPFIYDSFFNPYLTPGGNYIPRPIQPVPDMPTGGGGVGGLGGIGAAAGAAITNPNCIVNAVAGGTLGKNRVLIPTLKSVPGKGAVPTGLANHDGIHVAALPGPPTPVTALPAMAGKILWGNRQGELGSADHSLGIMDILLDTPISGQQYVMTLKDFNFSSMQKEGNVRPGTVLGTVNGSAHKVDERGLHVTLMPYSVYQSVMDGRPTGAKRASVPFGALMDAARDSASPFGCP